MKNQLCTVRTVSRQTTASPLVPGVQRIAPASGGTLDDGPGPLWGEGHTASLGYHLTAMVKGSGCQQMQGVEPGPVVFHFKQGWGVWNSHLLVWNRRDGTSKRCI